MNKKILFICSEPAIGMIPFAVKIINVIADDPEFTVFGIFVNSSLRGYISLLNSTVIKRSKFLMRDESRILNIINKFIYIKLIRQIKKTIKEEDIQIIHFLTGDSSLALYNAFVGFKNVERYYTVHDLESHPISNLRFPINLLIKYIDFGCKINLHAINNLTTSSKDQYEKLKKIYNSKKIIYTAFPSLVTERMKMGSDVPFEIVGIQNYILFFGVVKVYKGVELLIDSFNIIQKEHKCKLVIAGKGYINRNIKNEKNIIWLNRYIDDSEINSLFENANCIVYPYHSATMSGVLSIAEYFKKKIIISDILFFKQYFNDSMIMFETGNLNSLVKALKESYSIVKEIELSNFYEKDFSDYILIESYRKLYS